MERTKTTGSDKGVSVLPIFVSTEALIEVEWLLVGLDLWQRDELSYKRDYFLCLPSPDFSGPCGKKARYTDAQGFSKALMSSLRTSDGAQLLLPEAVSFWSEHSNRAGLDSWLASLSVGEDLRRFVGRWAMKGCWRICSH